MKLTVKTLITLVVAGSALLLTPTKSHAQVNMTTLAEVAKSCQKDAVSPRYYQQMLFNLKNVINSENINVQVLIEKCIRERYHYSLVLEQFPGLSSGGEIIRGYPGSVVVGLLAHRGAYQNLLDCLISEDASSDVCSWTRNSIALGVKFRSRSSWDLIESLAYMTYTYVCPSCVVAHDEVSGSQTAILRAFMKWFLTLEKSERRQVMSLLGDDDNARNLRRNLDQESNAAIEEYREARTRVQQQERERRRQELLGL